MPGTEDAGLIRLIEAFLREPLPSSTKRLLYGGITIKVQDLAAGKALLALEPKITDHLIVGQIASRL